MYYNNFDEFEKKHTLSGIVLIMENKILLVHPSKFKNKPKKWSIPKGHNEKLSDLQAAITELEEESNIKVSAYRLKSAENGILKYSKSGKNKELKYFVIEINRSEIGFKLYNDMILRYYLDKGEIAEAGFFSKADATDLIEIHQQPLLSFLS